MKTLEQLEYLLVESLVNSIGAIKGTDMYINEPMGDTSIYLTSILHEHIFNEEGWDKKRWLDDSLLTKFVSKNDTFSIWGVVISGKEGNTKQWTDPFYFKIRLSPKNEDFIDYTFLFGDLDKEKLNYTDYANDRGFWDRDFYSTSNWNPSERNWDFIINVVNDKYVSLS